MGLGLDGYQRVLRADGGKGMCMEHAVAAGVWAITVIAPCVISWLAGDMVGSARTRQLLAEEAKDAEASFDAAFRVQEWCLAGETKPIERKEFTPIGTPQPAVQMSFEEQAIEAERRRLRREAFASMPTLNELRDEAEKMRAGDVSSPKPEWSEAICEASTRAAEDMILLRYKQSILALQRHNANSAAIRQESRVSGAFA